MEMRWFYALIQSSGAGGTRRLSCEKLNLEPHPLVKSTGGTVSVARVGAPEPYLYRQGYLAG